MKKLLSLGLAALLAVGAAVLMMGSSAESAAPDNNTLKFDFTDDDGGFTPIFADYPNTEGVEDFYEFQHSYGEVPVPGAGKGLFISGNNHSDDLFMGYVRVFTDFSEVLPLTCLCWTRWMAAIGFPLGPKTRWPGQ